MKLLNTGPDPLIQETIDFMVKVDESTRDKIFSYARFSYSEYLEELKQQEIQHLQIVKSGGKA